MKMKKKGNNKKGQKESGGNRSQTEKEPTYS